MTAVGHDAATEVHFLVSDTGIGIPEEKQATIFEAFTQADASTTRRFGGSGLGLAISSRLVRLMRGHIWVESAPGRGSRFYVAVPLEVRAAGLRAAAPDAGESRALAARGPAAHNPSRATYAAPRSRL